MGLYGRNEGLAALEKQTSAGQTYPEFGLGGLTTVPISAYPCARLWIGSYCVTQTRGERDPLPINHVTRPNECPSGQLRLHQPSLAAWCLSHVRVTPGSCLVE